MKHNMLKEKDIIFALDIGTRNVVGIIGYEEDEVLHIVTATIFEHKTRAMLDGQIHDIHQVTQVIKQVKNLLEKELDIELKEVAIAAAGRVLRTICAEAAIEFNEEKRILQTHILSLEMQGVETAKQLFYDQAKVALDYYNVAHSTVKYYLDGYEIDNLEGHTGRQIKANIISTFLPKQVIDSLNRAVEGAQLTISNLTLEPISAINISIPKDLRLLNLALIDIGAGTSDIAITKEGSVVAYGMLPIAGDEFTEKLVEELLVDFNTAEEIKKAFNNQEEIVIEDILGSTQRVDSEKIIQILEPILEKMSSEISNKIIELNGGISPKAVFCVGGGSQFPGLAIKISEKLEIPSERVVIKNLVDIRNSIMIEDPKVKGPEFITPVGICLTTLIEQKNNFVTVKVNNNKVRLMNTKLLTIMDAAIKCNFMSDNFIVRNGKNLEFTYNEQPKKIKGTLGIPANITINNIRANLKSEITNGDIINLTPAISGRDASITIREIIDNTQEKNIYFGGKKINTNAIVKVNGNYENIDYKVNNNDIIITENIETLSDLLKYLEIDDGSFVFFINESLTSTKMSLNDGDRIDIMLKSNYINSTEEELEENKDDNGFTVFVNGEKISLEGKKDYIFVDIFNEIDFNLQESKGIIVLKLNGQNAAFTDKLSHEDKIEIYWE